MATWPTVTDDDGTGTTGTILDQALFNAIRDYIGGTWTSVTFNAANFTASSGNWTVASGDQLVFSYVEIGKTMIISLRVSTSTVSATPTTLRIAVPNGRTIASSAYGPLALAVDNLTAKSLAYWEAGSGAAIISFYTDNAGTAWSASTDNTYVWGQFIVEIS